MVRDDLRAALPRLITGFDSRRPLQFRRREHRCAAGPYKPGRAGDPRNGRARYLARRPRMAESTSVPSRLIPEDMKVRFLPPLPSLPEKLTWWKRSPEERETVARNHAPAPLCGIPSLGRRPAFQAEKTSSILVCRSNPRDRASDRRCLLSRCGQGRYLGEEPFGGLVQWKNGGLQNRKRGLDPYIPCQFEA